MYNYNLLLDKDVFGELRGSVPGDLCCGTRPATKTVYVAEVVSSLTDLFQTPLDKAYKSGNKDEMTVPRSGPLVATMDFNPFLRFT